MTHNASNPAPGGARLPGAAQRWLDAALPRGLDVPPSIRLEQEGSMEINGRWTPFKASGDYKAAPLSFIWRARFAMLPGVWIVAEDGHLEGQGWGSARLWGILPMGKRTDPEVLMTQLVRNLAELAWLPPFALADPGLTWAGAGDSAFEVRTLAGEREAVVRFEIDERGDIIRATSPARPYDVPGGYAEAPWRYEFGDHGEFGGLRIPASGVAAFDRGEGWAEYFRGTITAVTLGTGRG
jgi:hypothetical protein